MGLPVWWSILVIAAMAAIIVLLASALRRTQVRLDEQHIAARQAMALLDQVIAHPQTPPVLRARCANLMRQYAVRFGLMTEGGETWP